MRQKIPLSRYLPLELIDPLVDELAAHKYFRKIHLGTSVEARPISAIRFGRGPFKVLAWSQMHGNETTTTKALLEYLRRICTADDLNRLHENLSILAIPILNPDGAAAYTRENAAGVDLNRDAVALTQPESLILKQAFESFKPDLCLNLHGQRSIYGLTGTENPAILSFLAPAEDKARSVTKTRLKAMYYINSMCEALKDDIGMCIGRYDDSYNASCVGDHFTAKGTPTVLFEAGQYGMDYQRNNTKDLLVKALTALFETLVNQAVIPDEQEILARYLKIPENNSSFYDIIIKEALPGKNAKQGDIAIQYKEELKNGKVRFIPQLEQIGRLTRPFAHKVIYDNALRDRLSVLNNDQWPEFIEKYVLKKFRL